MTLEWEQAKFGIECSVCDGFILRIEPDDADWRATVIAGGRAEYRSTRTLPMEDAKALAIKHGARVARQLASKHNSIAACLKRQQKVLAV